MRLAYLVPLRVSSFEIKRERVDAISQPGRLWAIREDMPEMGIASAADDFITHHAMGLVGFLLYGVFINRRPVARPAGAGVVLCLRAEERLTTCPTAIDAFLFVFKQRTGEGSLGVLQSSDAIHIG